ncbi:DUF86 domain-containing protein [Candidatus Saccharibacteria bacterium]|nr:DUF86 domain-containing protein [Candidatus Saccharibacteria bacterium]
MEHRDTFLLEIIVEFGEKIQAAKKKYSINRDVFMNDVNLQDLCAFYVFQIGEHANDLSETFKNAHPKIVWHRITGLRNLIAHEYGSINPDILWDTLENNIPEFCTFCAEQIGKK